MSAGLSQSDDGSVAVDHDDGLCKRLRGFLRQVVADAALDDRGLAVAYPRQLVTTAPNYQPMIGNTLSHPHAADVLAHYRASMAAA